MYETATGKKLPDIRKSRYGGYPIMVLRFHPKNPKIIYAGTSEGQVLSCDISDFVHDGNEYDHIESDKDERWTEIIVGMKKVLSSLFVHLTFPTLSHFLGLENKLYL